LDSILPFPVYLDIPHFSFIQRRPKAKTQAISRKGRVLFMKVLRRHLIDVEAHFGLGCVYAVLCKTESDRGREEMSRA
jgi:hypothetical protein